MHRGTSSIHMRKLIPAMLCTYAATASGRPLRAMAGQPWGRQRVSNFAGSRGMSSSVFAMGKDRPYQPLLWEPRRKTGHETS